MKKLPLIFTLSFLILAAGGYFLYHTIFNKASVEPWDLVPESSVLVYESGTCPECLESAKQSTVGKIIQQASFYNKQNDSLKNILQALTQSQHNLVSLHVTKKDDFDFVFYARTKNKSFEIVINQWKKKKHYKFSEREFNGVIIQEISFKNQVFSWVLFEDICAGSFTPFLIEDVIRTYKIEEAKTFRERVSDVYQIPKMNNDAGNLYVHFENFAAWLNIFTEDRLSRYLQDFGKSSVLDIKSSNKNFTFNGISSDSSNKSKYILSLFAGQSPVSFNLKRFISNRTVMLTTYGISDGEVFGKNLKISNARQSTLKDTLVQISKTLPFDSDKFFKNIKGELGLSYVESKHKTLSQLLLIDTHDSKSLIASFNALSAKLSIDTIFFEKFSDYEIRELPLYRFPEKVFSPLISGFNTCYYTSIGSIVLIGEDLDELKKFLDDIDREETWGKSVTQNKFFESTLLESNISLYINTSKIWSALSNSANPKWKKFIVDNNDLLQSLGMGAIQFSHLNESFYTNISLGFKSTTKTKDRPSSGKKVITNFEAAISKMSVVKNHSSKEDEVLIQDSLHRLHLISSDGKILWKVELSGSIQGDMEQIDYFTNGKLQYLFATNNQIHIIDRLGNYVTPYPLTITPQDIEYLSLVDYDHSRKYRFLIATKSGALWMYDKDGSNLEGWKPKNLNESLVAGPIHHRLIGKDYILAIQKNGKIFLLNRRGETLRNFPIDINGRTASEYFVETGNSMATTYFIIITKDGFRIKFNLEGKVQSRETLLKTSGDAQFRLVNEQRDKSYLICRQDAKQLALLDENGKEIIVNEYVGHNPVDIKYTDYGAGLAFITITDRAQNLSFVYDAKGNLLTTPPLESYYTIVKTLENNSVKIFSVYQNALSIKVTP